MANSKIELRFQEMGSNKYYRIEVRQIRDGRWSTVANYGRIGRLPATNVLADLVDDRSLAVSIAQTQISKKIAKGYKIYQGAIQ